MRMPVVVSQDPDVKAKQLTRLVWPVSMWTAAPIYASQVHAVSSQDPDGAQFADLVWQGNVAVAARVLLFQSRTELSLNPEKKQGN